MDGNELKELLQRNGFKLIDVAKSLGISPQALGARFKVKKIKKEFITDLENVTGLEIARIIPRKTHTTEIQGLINILQQNNEHIGRLIAMLENEQKNQQLPNT